MLTLRCCVSALSRGDRLSERRRGSSKMQYQQAVNVSEKTSCVSSSIRELPDQFRPMLRKLSWSWRRPHINHRSYPPLRDEQPLLQPRNLLSLPRILRSARPFCLGFPAPLSSPILQYILLHLLAGRMICLTLNAIWKITRSRSLPFWRLEITLPKTFSKQAPKASMDVDP